MEGNGEGEEPAASRPLLSHQKARGSVFFFIRQKAQFAEDAVEVRDSNAKKPECEAVKPPIPVAGPFQETFLTVLTVREALFYIPRSRWARLRHHSAMQAQADCASLGFCDWLCKSESQASCSQLDPLWPQQR